MMKREEMEIANCTFHPNILRRSTPCDRPGEGGKGKVNRPDKGREGRVAVVASERLFEASKRLQDRRSEEQEGKKMWEEESFARSCTFQVRGRHNSL